MTAFGASGSPRHLPWELVVLGLLVAPLSSQGFSGSGPIHPVGVRSPVHVGGLSYGSPVPRSTGATPFSYPDNWPMYGYDTSRTGDNPNVVSIGRSNVSSLQEVWSYETNGSIFTSPLVVNGTVYFGSWDGYLYALNASNGALLWKSYLGQTKVAACRGNAIQGISSSPQLWNGTLYVGGGAGSWYALNASNGTIEWNLTVGNSSASGGSYNWASPLIYGNELYIGLASDCDNPLVRGGLLEVNLTGPLSVRSAFYAVPAGCLGDSIWSTPAVDPATNTIWVTTGNEGSSSCSYANANSVIVLNATSLAVIARWSVPMVLGLDSDFGDGTVFGTTSTGIPLAVVTNKNGLTYAFNRSNVSAAGWGPAWSVATGDSNDWSLDPSVFNGSAFFVPTSWSTFAGQTHAGSLWGLDPSNGAGRFHVATPSANRLPPAYTGGMLAVPSGPELEIVSSSTGATLKQFSTGAIDTDQFGPAAFGDGRLFVGTGNFSFNGGIVATTTHGRLNAYGIPFRANLSAVAWNGSDPAPVNYSFWANTSGGTGGVRCAWSFGDGSTGSGCAVAHTYSVGGNLTVRVVVTDDAWETQNLSTTVSVTPPRPSFAVAANVSSLTGIAPCHLTFEATPGGKYTAPVFYRWTFGDGNVTGTSAPRVPHLYTYGGAFTVEVVASDVLGNVTRAWLNVTIGPALSIVPSLGPLSGSAPLTVHGTLTVAGGQTPYGIAWRGDDGSASSTAAYSTTFANDGAYVVNLTVTDARGVQIQKVWRVWVSAANASMAASVSLLGRSFDCPTRRVTVELHAAVSGAAGPFSYLWTFGDGASSSEGPNVSHDYARVGQYPVRVEVSNGSGVSANASLNVAALASACSANATHGASALPPLLWALLLGIVTVAIASGFLVWRRRRRSVPN